MEGDSEADTNLEVDKGIDIDTDATTQSEQSASEPRTTRAAAAIVDRALSGWRGRHRGGRGRTG